MVRTKSIVRPSPRPSCAGTIENGAGVFGLLIAAIAGLQPGATVRLPPGIHEKIVIHDQQFDPPVTIDATGAVVRGLDIHNAGGIIWRGGTIEAPKGRGDADTSASGRGRGPAYHAAMVKSSRDISFENVTFTNAKIGMASARSNGLIIRDSRFTGMRSDGINSVGSSNVLIERNIFTDTRPIPSTGSKADGSWVDGDHCDAIQIWAPPDVPVATDIIIRDNIIEGPTQGINTFGPHGDGYQRIIVENNQINTSYAAGISVMNCTDCRVRYNKLWPNEKARHRINLRTDNSTGLFCENDIASLPARQPSHRGNAKCPVP